MTVTLSLAVDEASNLIDAHSQLDSYESVTPGVKNGARIVRVPYKLGATRRILIKNLNALKAVPSPFEEARKNLFQKISPEVPSGKSISQKDAGDRGPRGEPGRGKMVPEKKKVELFPSPAA